MKQKNGLSDGQINDFSYDTWVTEMEALPVEFQKEFIFESLKSKKHLHIYGRYFYPHIIRGTEDVPDCHVGMCNEVSRREDSAIIFPRGFAKSTWEKIDTLHDICYALEPVILYISDTLGSAAFHFESIKSELENNELLIKIYGDLVPPEKDIGRKWTNKHFETSNRINVVARGGGKGRGINIKNQRPTKIVCDDIENDQLVKSPEQREKLHRWLYDVVFPSKDKDRGFIKMIGTVLHRDCEILKFYHAHGGIFRKAIENGESIAESFFSLEKLMRVRDGYIDENGRQIEGIGTRSFSKEYLNNPADDTQAVIQMQWLEPVLWDKLEKIDEMKKIIMLDPQSGESKTADYYGLCVIAFWPGQRHKYLLKRLTGRATQIDQAALLIRTFQEYRNVIKVGVEKIMTQVAVYQIILDWISGKIDLPNVKNDNRNIPFLDVSPEGKDKKARLEMHQPAFERGEIHLHITDRQFAEKLTSFPDVDHDDDIDAFIYCLEWANRSDGPTIQSNQDVQPGIMAGIRDRKF